MAVKLYVGYTVNSQDKAKNTSNVTVNVTCSWTYGSFNLNKKPGSVTIDGTTYEFTSPFNKKITTTGTCTLYTKTVNVKHASDGTKTLNISAEYSTAVSSGDIAASAKEKLPTISAPSSSSSSSPSSSSSSANSNKVVITRLGVQNETDRTVACTWTWGKDNTDHYKIRWFYHTGNDYWYVGSDATSDYMHATYTAPSNAIKIKVKILPKSKTKTVNGKETTYWTAEWCAETVYDFSNNPPTTPPVPSIDIDDRSILKAELDNLDVNAEGIQFQVVANNSTVFMTHKCPITTNYAQLQTDVDPGNSYKVRCRSYRGDTYSAWSEYSANLDTVPDIPSGITKLKATTKTSVYLEWNAILTADAYDIEYATKKEYLDGSNQTTTVTGIETTHYELTGLESGHEYFFRLRAVNGSGNSEWSAIKSIIIGTDPSAPTTWSSTTTAVVGEPLVLYWVHNTEDGSKQTYSEIEMFINDVKQTVTIKDDTSEEEEEHTSSYTIDTSELSEGAQILWRVRTAGVTLKYGEWSVERVIDVYAKPTLSFGLTDSEGELLDVISSFPFYASALAGPKTQMPIGYHLSVTSNEIYETTDDIGNTVMVNSGEELYSQYIDTNDPLVVEFSAGNINLENSRSYTATCSVYMNSGLTIDSSYEFKVEWTDVGHMPNAEISVDTETLTASIRPYCERRPLIYHQVIQNGDVFTKTATTIAALEGSILENTLTETGEDVRIGIIPSPQVFYCKVKEPKTFYFKVKRHETYGFFVVTSEEIGETDGQIVPNVQTTMDEPIYWGISEDGEEFYFCKITGSISRNYRVTNSNGTYVKQNSELGEMNGSEYNNAVTTTGEKVYYGRPVEGTNVYFCIAPGEAELIEDVVLSVYRREFDGGFVKIADNIDNTSNTYVTDPHPALDYARYRIVATTKSTGTVSFYDVPGYPVGGLGIVVQWDEAWSYFDSNNEDVFEQPPWSGSMLKLPYNVDISDNRKQDVDLIQYIGRKRPVSYYGTQTGETANWSTEIPATDTEALYALRRLSVWMGDVYVREWTGSGYWANISVSYDQKHTGLTIPVKFSVTRVEGGI